MPSWMSRLKNNIKQSQYDENFIEDFRPHNEDDLQEFGNKEAWEDSQADAQADKFPDEGSENYYTIEPEQDGTFRVMEHGTYEESSVLSGRPKDAVVGFFDTIDQAQQKYPQADILEHKSISRFTSEDAMNMQAPSDFDPGDAGETW